MKSRPNIPVARMLRRENATEVEKSLWYALRNRQIGNAKLRRQHPLGRYILDFVCLDHGLVVELGGGLHNDPAVQTLDNERTTWLVQQGLRVLRFWNNDVIENMEGVLETIAAALAQSPPPAGGGGSG